MSRAGEVFAVSARAVKQLESCALTIGRIIDVARGLTMTPLSAAQRQEVAAALEGLGGLDHVRKSFEGELSALTELAKRVGHQR